MEWNEEREIVKGCAATILYRKRRNARLLPTPAPLNDLMKENQLSRLKGMIAQLLPYADLRCGRGSLSSASSSSDFEEFIYNPLRSATPRYRLKRLDI
ncbi:hypothetical protein OSTOST_12259, partial [Ostertagia ostertagi]